MNCRDFERLWNERLDRPEAADESVLEAHAASCAGCRTITARYRTLQTALRALGPLPASPVDLADRVLNELSPSDLRRPTRLSRPWALRAHLGFYAAAASVFLAVLMALRSGGGGQPHRVSPTQTATRVVRPIDPHALGNALATATSATLELARETSAPAARIGREVFDSARPSLPRASGELSLAVGVEPASDSVLPKVGDRIQDGVKPFSGAARSAFGFLLAPTAGG